MIERGDLDDNRKSLFGICPFVTASQLLQGKWALLIMYYLADGPVRFNQLRRDVDVAQGTLSKQLKALENAGIIARKLYNETPLRVEYELTPIGEAFIPVLPSIEAWGDNYLSFINSEDGSEFADYFNSLKE